MKVASFLIHIRVNINIVDKYNFNALLYAVKGNNTLMALYLIKKGVDYKIQDSNGCNSLHWSAHNNNLELFKVFYNLCQY